jgi:hypothetical protein
MSKLLEHIVRNVINEIAGKLNLKWRSLNDKDRAFLNQNAIPLLGIKSADRSNFKKYGGLVLTATRKFGREQSADGNKSFEYTPAQIKNNIRSMLNTLTSIWNPMKSAGYVWLVTTDIKPVEPDAREKSEKIIAKYEFLCMYVSRDSLTTNIDPKTKGYLYSLDDGALVFDWDSIDAKQWKRAAVVAVDDPLTRIKAPYNLISYGDKSDVVDQLYIYFDLVDLDGTTSATSIGFTAPTDMRFNCDLKSVIQWFQQTNNIPVTGNWDVATRNKALSIDEAPYIVPTSAFDSIRNAAASCRINSGETAKDINTITVPEGGFKFGITGDLNFWPVQLLMLAKYEELVESSNSKILTLNDDIYVELKRAVGSKNNPGQYRGDYGTGTREMVKFLINFFNALGSTLDQNPNLVEQSFIDRLLQQETK